MTTAKKVSKVLADLQVKAAIFGMDIDTEALTLAPKQPDTTPVWIKRWREKTEESDRPNTLGLQNIDLE